MQEDGCPATAETARRVGARFVHVLVTRSPILEVRWGGRTPVGTMPVACPHEEAPTVPDLVFVVNNVVPLQRR